MAFGDKKVSFDFYRVEAPDGYLFELAIKELEKQTELKDRIAEISRNLFRWEDIETESRFITGNIIKLRMSQLPSKGGLDSVVVPIDLRDDEGIAEENVFLYDKDTATLVYQRNKYGVSADYFRRYLLHFYKIQGGIMNFVPLLKEDGLKRLDKLDEIHKLSYRVARPKNKKYDRISDASTDEAIKILEDLEAMTVNVELSMYHTKGGMNIKGVKNRVAKLFGLGVHEPKKIFISGIDKSGMPDEFDLLKLRIEHKEDVSLDTNRSLTYEARKRAIKSAFRNKIEEIENLYSSESERIKELLEDL